MGVKILGYVNGEFDWIGTEQWKETEIDNINPQHYKNGIETIDYIQAVMDKRQFEGYLRGSIIKYISRYDKKNGVEDLKKAEWYQDRLIKLLEGGEI